MDGSLHTLYRDGRRGGRLLTETGCHSWVHRGEGLGGTHVSSGREASLRQGSRAVSSVWCETGQGHLGPLWKVVEEDHVARPEGEREGTSRSREQPPQGCGPLGTPT